MCKEVECPRCSGIGVLEDKKLNEYPCPDCKGKGSLDEEVIYKESN